ncbi:MAG: S-methyl-5'-thioinosine phosphorylase [Actinobacteria bacterium]|nr:S-methyl-5'-thioinosine phosphorylase [Actinomycetota bacterium]
MALIGIIAGTGFYNLPALEGKEAKKIETKYGSAKLTPGNWNGVEILFLTRHGSDHSVPPQAINYRANIQALKDAGVDYVIAVNVVGGIDPTLKPGDLQLIDDFVDFTSGREHTFFDGIQPGGVQHVDVMDCYDADVKSSLSESAKALAIPLRVGGIYAGFNGPRFETPAEIRFAALAGATVVGMTGCPEVSLAREAALRYGAIALIVNPAAGLSPIPITTDEISRVLTETSSRVVQIIEGALPILAGKVE